MGEHSQRVMREMKGLQNTVDTGEALFTEYDDIKMLIEMAYEEEDDSIIGELRKEIRVFEKKFEELRISTLLCGPYDKDNAIVTLHAGAGGTDSCDWATMLYRMYNRWAEKKGFSITVLDYIDGDITGIKGVTFEVKEKMLMGI